MDDIQEEPQEISAEATENEVTENQTDDQGAETSQEQMTPLNEQQQAKFDSVIGEKVAKGHEYRRERDEALRQNEELRANIPTPIAPDVPEMPNPDDFFDEPEKLKAANITWNKASVERAAFDTEQKVIKDNQLFQVQEQQRQEVVKVNAAVDGYSKNAKTFNITDEQLLQAGTTVRESGLSLDVQLFLLDDPQGPLIVTTLANNPVELDKIRSMSTAQAAAYIATDVKPNLAGTGKQSETPNPLDIVNGGGVPDKTPDSIKNAKFT